MHMYVCMYMGFYTIPANVMSILVHSFAGKLKKVSNKTAKKTVFLVICIHTYSCMHVYTYIHTYIHTYIYIYIYIYIHIQENFKKCGLTYTCVFIATWTYLYMCLHSYMDLCT